MIFIGLEIDARGVAVRKTLLARRGALSAGANLSGRAFVAAGSAVRRIRLRAYARRIALRRSAPALKRASTLHAHLAFFAFLAARSAVLLIAFRRDAIAVALREPRTLSRVARRHGLRCVHFDRHFAGRTACGRDTQNRDSEADAKKAHAPNPRALSRRVKWYSMQMSDLVLLKRISVDAIDRS
jgi:hypothetical protein